jgi:hypothetical protein
VWSGVRDASTPAHGETILWRVTNGTSGRYAEARVQVTRYGRELRITVDGEVVWSRVFGRREGVNELISLSDGFRMDLERVGWTHDVAG